MRTLSLVEVEQVSGAGAVADALASLGAGIGAVIDAANCSNKGTAESAGRKLGKGIGDVIEAALCGTGTGTGGGGHGGCCGGKPSKPTNPCKPSWC